jgi:hypothetical protein
MLTLKGQEAGEEEEVVVKELVGATTTDPLVVFVVQAPLVGEYEEDNRMKTVDVERKVIKYMTCGTATLTSSIALYPYGVLIFAHFFRQRISAAR